MRQLLPHVELEIQESRDYRQRHWSRRRGPRQGARDCLAAISRARARTSLAPKYRRRIETRRPPQGNQAADERHHRRQPKNDWQKDDSWRCRDAEDGRSEKTGNARAKDEPERSSYECEHQVLRQKQLLRDGRVRRADRFP